MKYNINYFFIFIFTISFDLYALTEFQIIEIDKAKDLVKLQDLITEFENEYISTGAYHHRLRHNRKFENYAGESDYTNQIFTDDILSFDNIQRTITAIDVSEYRTSFPHSEEHLNKMKLKIGNQTRSILTPSLNTKILIARNKFRNSCYNKIFKTHTFPLEEAKECYKKYMLDFDQITLELTTNLAGALQSLIESSTLIEGEGKSEGEDEPCSK